MSDGEAQAAMWRARWILLERQRRFEWALAIANGRAAGAPSPQLAHDLRNFVQIVELGLMALDRRLATTDPVARALLDDLRDAAIRGKTLVEAATGVQVVEPISAAGPPVAAAIEAALVLVRPALPATVELVVELAIEPTTRTACTADELEALIGHLVLDARAVERAAGRVALIVRERDLDGRAQLELRRDDAAPIAPFARVVIDAIVARAGGDISPTFAITLPIAYSSSSS